MRETLIDLITRMTVREPYANSDDSVAWHAHREAEKLDDASMIDDLVEYVRSESNKERRKAAYFILGKMGEKFRSSECVRALVAQLYKETDKYALSTLLGAVRHIFKPNDLDLSAIFALMRDSRWLVRHSAIQSLKRTSSPEVEDRLIEVLQTSTDVYDIVYCQATLNEVGTAKAIPFIAKNLNSRKRDVKYSAQYAIESIQARERRSDIG